MRKFFLLVCIAAAMIVACATKKPNEEEAIRSMCTEIAKAYIHSAGVTDDVNECWKHTGNQEGFLESMAAAAQAVHDLSNASIPVTEFISSSRQPK